LEGGGGVLEGLALDEAGQEQVALLPQGELVVEVELVVAGQQAPALSSTSVAAISRNSVAMSRSRCSIRSSSAR
jgi:hypothetical protein